MPNFLETELGAPLRKRPSLFWRYNCRNLGSFRSHIQDTRWGIRKNGVRCCQSAVSLAGTRAA
jgi:hypothetical protein